MEVCHRQGVVAQLALVALKGKAAQPRDVLLVRQVFGDGEEQWKALEEMAQVALKILYSFV